MRLIDADSLPVHKFVVAGTGEPYAKGWNDAIEAIMENEPTVEERPHGEWIGRWTGQEHIVYCSNCKEEYYPDDLYQANGDELPNFCLKCGADMRGGADNES